MSAAPESWKLVLELPLEGTAAPRAARWAIHDLLGGSVGAPFLADVLLATSEIVTNAVTYTSGPCRLLVYRQDGSSHIKVAVADPSTVIPERVDDARDPVSGRGLRIVEMVASSWGVDPQSDGKAVWFEMAPEHLH